jgi:hypothetical protein
MGSEYFFEVADYLKNHPGINAYNLTKDIKIHVATAQKILDAMERYGFAITSEKKGLGRPSKTYTYKGGDLVINIDQLVDRYQMRNRKIREKADTEVKFSYDVDKEIINAILLKGKTGKKIKVDDKFGKLLWLVPPPDSEGNTIDNLAREAGVPVLDAIEFLLEMMKFKIIEEIK